MEPLRLIVETGKRRVFASALDWPGWSRSGRNEDQALAAVLGYAPRFAPVAGRAGLPWPGSAPGDWSAEVVQRVPGTPTTDFGAPDAIGDEDRQVPDQRQAARLVALVDAAWDTFDDVVSASPPLLRKGPRGGGRDRDKMVAHVLGAEAAYARRLGLTVREPEPGDAAGVEALRAAISAVVAAGQPVASPRRTLWPVRYGARRIAWHVLDHAWEMEDRRV